MNIARRAATAAATLAALAVTLGSGSREQAAAMIPGGPSHTTLDKISYLRDVADDTTLPADVRERARDGVKSEYRDEL